MFANLFDRVRRAYAGFRQQTEGFAAVEFAMVVPIMIVMFIGTVELCEAYTVSRRVVTISSSVADLVAQTDKLTDNDLDDIMRIADSLLTGYDSSRLDVKIISVLADNRGNPLVDWSYEKGGSSPLNQGTPYNSLPIGMIGPGQSVIVAEVSYDFTPPIGQNFLGSILLKETFQLQPRQSVTVARI